MDQLIKPVLAADLGQNYAFGPIKSLGEGLSYLVQPAFAIAAVGVVLYLVIGAVRMILSGGDKNAVAAARSSIIHAIIGFMLLILMFLILQFVPEFLGIGTEFRVIK